MRKCLTKVDETWFERIPSKFTKEERQLLLSCSEEQRSSILRAFEGRSLKKPSKTDEHLAEEYVSKNLPKDSYIINIILPSFHGIVFSRSKGVFRF